MSTDRVYVAVEVFEAVDTYVIKARNKEDAKQKLYDLPEDGHTGDVGMIEHRISPTSKLNIYTEAAYQKMIRAES